MKHRILIVDDEADSREPLLTLLSTWGYEVEAAGPQREGMHDDPGLPGTRDRELALGGDDTVTVDFGNNAAMKVEADGVGHEKPLAVDDWMEVAVFARRQGEGEHTESALYLQPQHITQNKGRVEVVVDAKPFEVGVDPYNKLIDRNPDDNRKRVE